MGGSTDRSKTQRRSSGFIVRHAATALALTAMALGAQAQSVALSGVVGTRALLVVNGGSPKMVAPGETYQGVRVISAQSDSATVEIDGKRVSLRMGDSPVSVGGAAAGGGGNRVVLPAGSGGHFVAQGTINGSAATLVVDTGATFVTIGRSDAERMGLDYTKGTPVRTMTANGEGRGYNIKLDSIRIGDVQVYGVDATVISTNMPVVLLGNSFLGRFSMQRESDRLVLEKRY